jgi:hypothetical protein
MDKELEEKIKSLKSNGKTKKGPCTSCKKKKPVTELPQLIEDEVLFSPSRDEILLAYTELNNKDNSKHEFINKVYQFLFGEVFDFGCNSCVNRQTRKFKTFINEQLKIPVT